MSLELKNATVVIDAASQSPESLAEAIEDMGFECIPGDDVSVAPIATETQFFPITGVTVESLQQALAALTQLRGVLAAEEGGEDLGISVTYVPSLTGTEQLGEVLSRLVAPASTSSPNAATPPLSPLSPPPDASARASGAELVRMRVEGMVCLSCTTTIEGKIGKLKGVEKIKGNWTVFVFRVIKIKIYLLAVTHDMCYATSSLIKLNSTSVLCALVNHIVNIITKQFLHF